MLNCGGAPTNAALEPRERIVALRRIRGIGKAESNGIRLRVQVQRTLESAVLSNSAHQELEPGNVVGFHRTLHDG